MKEVLLALVKVVQDQTNGLNVTDQGWNGRLLFRLKAGRAELEFGYGYFSVSKVLYRTFGSDGREESVKEMDVEAAVGEFIKANQIKD